MNLLLHPLSQKRYDSFVADPPQSLVLVAPIGSGKYTLLKQLAADILGDNPQGRLTEILADAGKKGIGIDAIRELKLPLRLKSNKPRVVLINQAGLLTLEAQNSILKLLEDTPNNVHFLIGVNNANDLLETIRSRTVMWQYILPTKQQIVDYFNMHPVNDIQKAIAIGENRIGLISALLQNDQNHPLKQKIETAKELLSQPKFERLVRVEAIYKDTAQVYEILEAIELVCKAAMEAAAQKQNANNIKAWHKRLCLIIEAREQLNANIQPKLVLSYIFTVL